MRTFCKNAMKITEKNGSVILEDTEDFDISQTFGCGQCFRFVPDGDGSFAGTALGRYLRIRQDGPAVTLENTSAEEFSLLWKDYFDLDTDYAAIRKAIATDEVIVRAMNAAGGIRILRQDLWECLISFIVSQNNNIPRIRKIIEALSERYGRAVDTPDGVRYLFPEPEALAAAEREDLRALGTGYRDEYILRAAEMTADGSLDLRALEKMPTKEARKVLTDIKGIGGKVADCILLFGMHRTEVCPHDVWVKRIFTERYHIDNISEKKGYAFAEEKWGQYAGYAQQYLFYAERERI